MYLRILNKDMKRKKTTNIILLIFIILAVTFISSSVNNMYVITSAIDSYFDKAGLSDFIIVTTKEDKNDDAIANFLNSNKNIDNWFKDDNLYLNQNDIKIHNGNAFSMSSTGIISSYDIKQQKFFDQQNNEIKSIKDGTVYLPIALMEKNELKTGDVITFQSGTFHMDFTIAGSCKDAFLGSTMMGTTRFIISPSDYEKVKNGSTFSQGNMYSINTSDMTAFTRDFNQQGFNQIVACDQKLIATTYVMDMVLAGILLIVSICLILISLVILRFTIVFTLNEEFREIGIMKAIGLKEKGIRSLYVTKYLAISLAGAVIGFVLSVPFGGMFLKQVSKNFILGNHGNGLWINIICSIFVVGVVVFFCYTCTRQVKKLSPVDAIRNGSNGERFKRKGLLKLSNARIPAVLYLALNDILSGLRRYGVLIITFTIGVILIIVPVNTINTLNSDQLVKWFGMAESDAYLVNEDKSTDIITTEGREGLKACLNEMKQTLSDNGIPATAFCETIFKLKISYKDYGYTSLSLQGTGTTTDQYDYTEGEAPKYENEVALTHITADEIGAKIGDTVKIKTGDTEKEFIVTAIYQSMNNMGEGIRFSEKAELDYHYAFTGFAFQIKYSDNPSKQEKEERLKQIKKLYPDFDVYTGGEYLNRMMGNISEQIQGVKRIIVIVVLIINMLVAVLMEKTFITKEKSEIGMLKSLGFTNLAIVQWQVIRIGLILVLSTILGAALSGPLSQFSSGKIFEMMGASHIEFAIKPLEIYVFYPLMIFITTIMASIITAMQIRRIAVQEINNIE